MVIYEHLIVDMYSQEDRIRIESKEASFSSRSSVKFFKAINSK